MKDYLQGSKFKAGNARNLGKVCGSRKAEGGRRVRRVVKYQNHLKDHWESFKGWNKPAYFNHGRVPINPDVYHRDPLRGLLNVSADKVCGRPRGSVVNIFFISLAEAAEFAGIEKY